MGAAEPPADRELRTGGRILRMLAAAALGWLAGFLLSAPIQLQEVIRVGAGDESLLFVSALHGLLVWALITGAIGFCSLVALLGPLATFVSARWVVSHPRISAWSVPGLVAIPLGYRLVKWFLMHPGPYVFRGPIFADYTVFIFAFHLTASLIYLRLLRRRLDR